METKEVISLFCKLGYLFANCDGKYDNQEKQFISQFINGMVDHKSISVEEGERLISTDYTSLTFDSVVNDIKAIISLCPIEQKENLLNEFNIFVEDLIEVDGVIAEEEKVLHERWINAIQ